MDTLSIMLSVVSLLFIATGVFFLSRRVRVPYTILLVVAGLVLIPISRFEPFHFIQSFSLTPGLLFFVFLPTLIFESAYNINIRNMFASIRSISLLSVVSLLISAFAIAFGLEWASRMIGYPVPFEITLLFGALISATDPVAVLALFKEYGAPRRLSLIFEGESLFNDGTALALFLVVLEFLTHGTGNPGAEVGVLAEVANGTLLFVVTVVGGILFGAFMGLLFSKLIQKVHNNEFIEITLTMIVAHFTFILTELISQHLVIAGHEFHLSAIIATVVAAIVVGNYGRYKISPEVLEYMEHFWGYFAFVVNSIIFILIGLLFASLPISLIEILPITLAAIVVVAVSRAISVYPVLGLLNLTKKEEYIPRSWQHLLAWGSLRGALAVTMVLLIPDDFTVPGWTMEASVKDFITALTISCIYFTLFVKGMTIGPMLSRFKLNALRPIEVGEYFETKATLYAKLLLEIERFARKGYISESVRDTLREKYERLYRESCAEGRSKLSEETTARVLTLFALSTAKHSLHTLFVYSEVSESVHNKILNDLNTQIEAVERGEVLASITLREWKADWLDQVHDLWEKIIAEDPARDARTLHMYYRAQTIIMRKALEEIEALAALELEIFQGRDAFHSIVQNLSEQELTVRGKDSAIMEQYPQFVRPLAIAFAEAGLTKARKQHVEAFSEREVITPKVRALLMEEIESLQT